MATLTNQTLLVMVGSYPRDKRATIPRQNPCATDHIPMPFCPQNTTAGRVWLYTLLYGNSLYRLYATAIHRPLIVPARPSRYTAYTAIQLYSYTRYTAYRTIQRPSRRDRAAGRRAVVGRKCLMSSAACSSIACASQPVAALGRASSSPSRTALWGGGRRS